MNIDLLMRTQKIIFSIFLVFLLNQSQAQKQEIIRGEVYELNEENNKDLLVGANVYWLNSTIGSVTDENGKFEIERFDASDKLVVSFIGYENDTLSVKNNSYLEIELNSSIDLAAVDVVHRQKSTISSHSGAIKVDKIGEKELLKAACCNLSESFETSPSVDVSFTDAVTGTRQIEMLGLAGPYTQITRENMPDVRGLASLYGLTFTPGTWISSIQLNKGTGSVVNGFESIAGQINVELQKPEDADKLYLNVYANQAGRLETNANLAFKLSDKWATGILLHAKTNSIKQDRNNDGFLDMPIGQTYIALNRWKYSGDNGLRLQFGLKATYVEQVGGQVDFNPVTDAGLDTHWGMKNNTNRYEAWMKIGKVYVEKPWRSVGFQLSGLIQDQENYFGLTKYEGRQEGAYANLIYQSIIGNTDHVIRLGASFQYDDYQEELDSINYDHLESVQGVFGEYTYFMNDQVSMVAGLRGDYHNSYGFFVTPRLHVRYAPQPTTVIRASAGRGQRTAIIIAENLGLLASSREWMIVGETNPDLPYGLEAEVAWNFGANISQDFELFYREGVISADFYYTTFVNQIVVDRDYSARELRFYNLDGKSFSQSFQIQFDYELVNRLDLRLAYRWYDVKTNYSGDLLSKPFVSTNRAFINLAYQTRNYWSFDFTLNWQGAKRIPSTKANPVEYQLAGNSPSFFIANMQVSKNWKKKFEIYAGVENLFNFRQEDPIIASEAPFSAYFDATMIWGPIFGRNIYAGLRYYLR
jgi:outer membrane receptor for ferrienterochelin and colicin